MRCAVGNVSCCVCCLVCWLCGVCLVWVVFAWLGLVGLFSWLCVVDDCLFVWIGGFCGLGGVLTYRHI